MNVVMATMTRTSAAGPVNEAEPEGVAVGVAVGVGEDSRLVGQTPMPFKL